MVEHRSTKSEVLRFDSSWRLSFFFLCPTLVARRKTSFPTLLLNLALGNFEKLACLTKKLSQNLKFAERNEV